MGVGRRRASSRDTRSSGGVRSSGEVPTLRRAEADWPIQIGSAARRTTGLSGSAWSARLSYGASLDPGSSIVLDRSTCPSFSSEPCNTPSRVAPTLRSAPLPRLLATAARASSLRAPIDVEGELQDERCGITIDALVPEAGSDREPPLGRLEVGVEAANLEDPYRLFGPVRHDGEADEIAGRPLAVRPRDESLEGGRRRRRRRHEPRDLFVRNHGPERGRVRQPRLTQRHDLSTSAPEGPAASRPSAHPGYR